MNDRGGLVENDKLLFCLMENSHLVPIYKQRTKIWVRRGNKTKSSTLVIIK